MPVLHYDTIGIAIYHCGKKISKASSPVEQSQSVHFCDGTFFIVPFC